MPEKQNPSKPALAPASVVIACYSDLDIFERNLAAFARQTHRDFELIVADDGSPQPYGPLLEKWAPRFSRPIQHVRHDDIGFRKTRILNRAVLVSRFDRLIFIDQDCLPHHHFVRDHLAHSVPGAVLAARRAHVRREDVPAPEEIFARGLGLGPLRLLSLRLRGRAALIEHGLPLPFPYEIAYRGILGSNFSISKADFVKINGFNAAYAGPGWEDTDIDFRLRLVGIRIRTLRHVAVEYHVDHPVRVINDLLNQERLQAVKTNRVVRAPVGLEEIREGDFERHEYGRAAMAK